MRRSQSPFPSQLATLFLIALFLPITLAQFGNLFQGSFHNPFGGQQQQQNPQHTPHREHKGWNEMESGECTGPQLTLSKPGDN
jgi:hypothetical protein